MKKLIALILILALTLSLTACVGEKPAVKETPDSTGATETPAPTTENIIDTEPPAEVTAQTQTSDDPYGELESTIETDAESVLTALEDEWKTLSAAVTDYASYVTWGAEINSFYDKIYIASATLCVQMREYSIQYAEAILASEQSFNEMYDDLERIYELIYDDMGDDIYDGIYDGVLDEMYDGLYSGALDDRPEDVEYADWANARSAEYDMWSDMRSETYEQWSDFRSEVYEFYSDLRSEVYQEDMDNVWDEITDFAEDTQEMRGELTATVSGTKPTEATTETMEGVPETVTDATDGIRPEFKAAMDSYEEFFDDYVAFMKSYMEDPFSMMGEYASMMMQYTETMAALDAIDDGTLSNEEAIYYAEVTLRINQKLMEIA